ncbi:MAG: UDP-diphospho-muramoylpentapeptide beta-N-acetylglucosaminyltransferase [Oscillospiraceae bacterium]|nr:UDP-diphospho-muramoylpentapeptide beta-N-acetylglucosaminyltransferase [Oscillospiraceae bacterium]
MNILILSAKFGMGHWSAAQSLRQQLEDTFPEIDVDVEDLITYAMPNAAQTFYKAFALLVSYGSGFFNTYYKMMENIADIHPFLEPVFVERLAAFFSLRHPAAVIVTHPFCAQVVSRYKRKTGDTIPLLTSVTDLSSHSEWITPFTDAYLVGTPSLRDAFVQKGVPRERICVTGIPVRAEFWAERPCPHDGDATRKLLIMGGGLGFMPQQPQFYEQLGAMPCVETTVITGHNQKLYQHLAGKYPHINVIGYTDRVYEYMAQSHLLLSKPGGITLFESIFAQLPMLAWEPFLQQEKKNARFLSEAGIGRVAGKGWQDCLSAIRALINNEDALADMSRRMWQLRSLMEHEGLNRIVATLTGAREVCVS